MNVELNQGSAGFRRAFLLLDLLLAIVVMAILAAVALPALRPNDSLKLISGATMVAADLEFAQASTLEDPTDPVIFRVDDTIARYWLARQSAPDTPITKPNGSPHEVQFGEGAHDFLDNVGIHLDDTDDGATVSFDPFGRLTQTKDTLVVLTSPTGELAVRIASATGSVYIGK